MMRRYNDPDRVTIAATAMQLGVAPRTIVRWQDEGRLPRPLRRSEIAARLHDLVKRKRGPRRNPRSIRYTTGRHDFYTTRNP